MKGPPAVSQSCIPDSPQNPTTGEVTVVTEEREPRPLRPIRRFDVFAETKRLEALSHGEPDDVAKGYGIRIAKIVASRRFGGAAKKTHHEKKDETESESQTASRFGGEADSKFRALDGEIQ